MSVRKTAEAVLDAVLPLLFCASLAVFVALILFGRR